MKYVIFKQKQLLMPVIIPEHVTHSQIKIVGAKPISAGFFENESGIVNTFGKSESLNLKSKPEDGSRQWHMGRCNNFWDKIPYIGEFKPWCMGGYGYVISRYVLEKALPNFNYLDHIYEDVYIGILMNSIGIEPYNIETKEYLVSPDHK